MAFNPNEHLMQLQNKDYLEVKWRLVWFREQCPEGTIETEMIHLDLDRETEEETYVWNNEKRRKEKIMKTGKGLAVFRATVKDGKGGVATGTKMEKAAAFPDYLEKAETGAIGRALAGLGYGTQFTGDEFNEAHRIVDSPVERPAPVSTPVVEPVQTSPVAQPATNQVDASATDEQINSINKLSERLNKKTKTDGLTYLGAKDVIRQLTTEYRELKQQQSKAS